jgi:hypothetical protein
MKDAAPVRRLQCPRNLDAEPQCAAPVKRTTLANQCIKRTVRGILQDDERSSAGGRANLQNVHDVRVPREPAHGTLLTHEPLEVFGVKVGGQHLDGDGPIQRALRTAVDHAETAPADLLRLGQTDRRKLPGDIANNVLLGDERIAFGHHTALDRECTGPWPG